MDRDILTISIQESNGMKLWELEDIPQPNEVNCGTAHYYGQKKVEHLLKAINTKAFNNHSERFLDPFFSIFESSLEQGVKEEGTVQWDDRSFYIRISWAGYSWKLPQEIKRRMVQIDISKVGVEGSEGMIRIPLKKLADDGSVILISPKIASKMNLRNGNPVIVKIRFCE